MPPDLIPEGIPSDDFRHWDVPTATPVYGDEVSALLGLEEGESRSVIPELEGRNPTHNESVLLAGIPISMASTNVDEIWYNWQNRKLFVRFLNGGLYTYNGA